MSQQGATECRKRIQQLREAMQDCGVQACVIPSADPHLSEYLPEHWQAKRWLTGFTGSMGTVVITRDFAGLWADGRYWVQAEKQMAGTGVVLMKLLSQQDTTAHIEWLAKELPAGSSVAVSGDVCSVAAARVMENILRKSSINALTDRDLVGQVWHDRQPLPRERVYIHDDTYAGLSCQEKLMLVRNDMRARGAEWHVISSLDDIAWLTNLRGNDVNYMPVFLAHMLLGAQSAILFVDGRKISDSVRKKLKADGIDVAPYEDAAAGIGRVVKAGSSMLIDPVKVTLAVLSQLPQDVRYIESVNPSTLKKACKTAKEVALLKEAGEEDGAALCDFFVWLEERIESGEPLNELDIDPPLLKAREKRNHFIGPSFETMAAFDKNAALPHYQPSPADNAAIAGNSLLLLDCGGQYLHGTTDISRIVPVGEMTPAQKRDASIVLKSVIAMSTACFPEGVEAPLIDAIARDALWREHIDYRNGTGHGVGYFLGVHEGPQVLSYFAPPLPQTKLCEGMLLSIEPGVYRPGQWGLRIENLVVVRRVEQPKENTFGAFMTFETVTYFPIDIRCLDVTMLNETEKTWLNDYHKEVYARLSPKVEGNSLAWLKKRTQPI